MNNTLSDKQILEIQNELEGDLYTALKKARVLFEEMLSDLFELKEPNTSHYKDYYENLSIKSFIINDYLFETEKLIESVSRKFENEK